MSRGGESAGKRRIAAQRNDRKAAKSERRQQRREDESPVATGQAEQERLMSRFHRLNELRAAGTITEEDFELQRHEIFVTLGLEDP